MKHANLFDTDHPVREDHDEDSTSGEKNNNIVRTTAAATFPKSPPQMKLFYSKSSATTKRGCYGTLDFLTSQALFENSFGKNHHMFAAQPNNLNNTNNKEATTKYLDLCKLEILLDGV